MERKAICNGCYINTISLKKFKTNFLCINMMLPLEKRKASLASLLAFVLKHGSKKYPDIKSVAYKAEELYGSDVDFSIRKKGDIQVISFYIDYVNPIYLTDNTDMNREAFDFLKEILFNSLTDNGSFNEDFVETEKQNLCDLIASRKNNKTSYARKRCAELLAKGQPYELYELGDIDEVKTITSKELYEFYLEFIEKSVIEIFAIGEFNGFETQNQFENLFKSRTPYELSVKGVDLNQEFTSVKETEMVEQAKLSMGFVFENTSFSTACYNVFLMLFAASPNSFLFMNVREKMSLCYYCSALIEKMKKIMVVYSGVLPEKLKTAETEILNQLEQIKKGAFTDEDLENAKRYYLNSLDSVYDSSISIHEFALNRILQHELFDIENTKREISLCTAETVKQIAAGMKYILNFTLLNEE